jgi:superoxide dismutase, Cu-Zn family
MGNFVSNHNEAIVVYNPRINNDVSGNVIFSQLFDKVKIDINLYGLKDGLHGFHIHKAGDLRDGCDSACDHYNPTNVKHGGLNNGHSGDLGNIIVKNGICNQTLYTNKFIIDEIIGRSLIIHENSDDLGLTFHKDSHTTGNSGKRICCAIIGISKNSC